MKESRKKIVFFGVLFFTIALSLELSSVVGLYVLESYRPEYFVDTFIEKHFSKIDDSYISTFRAQAYDSLLGWDHKPDSTYTGTNAVRKKWTRSHGDDGSRTCDSLDLEFAIASYGDSLTLGAEVNDCRTWQYYLSKILGVGVKNFGVGGYGPGQVLLKIKRHMENDLIYPITIFGIPFNAAARSVNSFRPFYHPRPGILLGFKPSFLWDGERVKYYANPNDGSEFSIQSLKQRAREASRNDYWVNWKLERKFPYMIQGARALRILVNIVRRDKTPGLVKDEQGSRIMEYMIDEFYSTAKSNGSVPVLLFMAVEAKYRQGEKRKFRPPEDIGMLQTYGRNKFAEMLKTYVRNKYADMIVIDIDEQEFLREKFYMKLRPGAHFSRYGNKVVGEIVARELGHLVRSVGNDSRR